MPAVVTFWQLPEEEQLFLTYLESTGTVLALPDHWVKKKEDLSPRPIRAFIADHDPDQLLFGLEEHLAQIPVERWEYEGQWGYQGPSAMDSCLIAYHRPKFRDEKKLGQSNLAAYWTSLDESQSAIIDKDPEFVRWGKRVFAWVRRHTPEQHQRYRTTKRAKEVVENGVVELVP